jgi:hypothetical protein
MKFVIINLILYYNEILGGYNPIMWETRICNNPDDIYDITKDSFMFSFINEKE